MRGEMKNERLKVRNGKRQTARKSAARFVRGTDVSPVRMKTHGEAAHAAISLRRFHD